MSEIEKKNPFEEKYEGMKIAELGAAMKSKKDELTCLKEASTEVQKEFDALRKHIVPEAMENAGIDSVKLKDVGRLSTRGEIYASIVAEDKTQAYDWLINNEFADVIKPGVNASTLKALLKECIMNGVEIPEELFKAEPYTMAVITKN